MTDEADSVAFQERTVVDASDPLLLGNTHLGTYEVRSCAVVLGEEFLLASCTVIRTKEGGISRPNWLHRWVRPFCEAMRNLRDYVQRETAADEGWCWQGKKTQWDAFIEEYKIWLARERGFTRGMVQFDFRDTVLRLLAARGVISPGVSLGALTVRKPKKERRSGKKPPPALPLPRYVGLTGRSVLDGRPYLALGESFVESYVKLAAGLASEAGVEDTIEDYRETARKFLEYLRHEKNEGRHSVLFSQLNSGPADAIAQGTWEALLHEWREVEREKASRSGGERKLKTADDEVRRLKSIWAHLAQNDLVVPVHLPGFKGSHRKSQTNPRPSLAQLFSPELVEGAVKSLVTKFDKSDTAQARQFIRALCQDVGAKAVAAMTSTELANAAIELNDRRLAVIRECAESDFLKWKERWRRGQALLMSGGLTAAEVLAHFDAVTTMAGERQQSYNTLFTRPEPEVALANTLKLIFAENRGRVIGVGVNSGRHDWLAKKYGGRQTLQAYLHPHIEAVTALYLVLLVDSGANVEVVRDTPFDCLGALDGKGQQHVKFGRKLRAGGKQISDYLCIAPQAGQKVSSLQALREYIEMSAGMRELAAEDVAARLLLTWDTGGVVGAAKGYRLREQVDKFVERHWERLQFRFTASSIRVSVLMGVHNHHPAGLQAAKERADHADDATTLDNYTGKMPNELLWNGMIREYVDRLQAMAVVTVDEAAVKLGMSQEQFDWLVSEGARTGLGIASLDPLAGVKPETREGDECDSGQCPSDHLRWVVATAESVADMILLNQHLNRQQSELAGEDMFAWEQCWLPTLAFTEVALRKLASGETADILAQARVLVAQRKDTYEPFPLY